jgi:hypothetical protein
MRQSISFITATLWIEIITRWPAETVPPARQQRWVKFGVRLCLYLLYKLRATYCVRPVSFLCVEPFDDDFLSFPSVFAKSDWLWAGWSGNRIPMEARFSTPFETDSGVHPVFCKTGTGCLSMG